MPAAPKPSARASRLSAMIRSTLNAALALALRTILRAASASRTRAASFSRSSAVTTARPACSAYFCSTARCASPGRRPSRGQVDRHACRAAGPRRRAAARSAGPAGARRRGPRAARRRAPTPSSRPARRRAARAARSASGPTRRPSSISTISWSIGVRRPCSDSRASSLPATAITSSLPSSRTTEIAAMPKPASSVTPSAISWRASRDGRVGPDGDACRRRRRSAVRDSRWSWASVLRGVVRLMLRGSRSDRGAFVSHRVTLCPIG